MGRGGRAGLIDRAPGGRQRAGATHQLRAAPALVARYSRCSAPEVALSFTPPTPEELLEHLEVLPIFPLPGVVFLPSSLLPLHVFEPRYCDLVKDALAGPRLISVPQLAPGWEAEYDGNPAVHQVAGLGQIVRHQALDDGRYNIILYGVARVRIVAETPVDTGYRRVRASLLSDELPPAQRLQSMIRELQALGASLMAVNPELAGALSRVAEGRSDPVRYVDTVAHLVLTGSEIRQEYLEQDAVGARCAIVENVLATLLAGTEGAEA